MDILSEKVTIVNRENNLCYPYLLYIKPMTFVDWLNQELDKRNWTRNELARRAGISDVSLTLIYGGKRKPGPELCKAIAETLKIPIITVYRHAGLLPMEEESDKFEELKYWFLQLSEDEQNEYLAIWRWRVERHQGKKGNSDEPGTASTGTNSLVGNDE